MSLSMTYFIFLLFFGSVCRGETPFTVCGNPRAPYKVSEESCASFNDICLMKGNIQCDNFQALCSQCPATNFSVLTFLDIQNLKSQNKILAEIAEHLTKRIDELYSNIVHVKIEILNKTMKEMVNNKVVSGRIETYLIIIVAVIILSAIIFVVEIRFKLISKSMKYFNKKNYSKYKILESRKSIQVSELNEKLDKFVQQIDKRFAINSANRESVVKFRINDLNEQIELNIKHRYNNVQIKKKICSQLSNTKYNNYKIMRLKYNENILDDNRYLLPYITDGNIAVECEVDHSINDQEIVIIKMDGDVNIPKLLQIHRNKTIKDLRRIISMFTDNSDYLIVKESNIKENESQNIKSEILKDESTIEECKLSDGDSVKIIKKKSGRISVKSIIEEKDCLVIEYSNTELVSTISEKLANKFGSDPNDFYLFLNNECLDKDKKTFEYNIDEKSTLKYYCYMKLNGKFDIDAIPIDKGFVSELYRGRDKISNKDTIIAKYIFDKTSKAFSRGIIKYSIIKSYPRTVKIYGLYYDENNFYVSMEYLSGRTLTTLLKQMEEENRMEDLTEDTIIKWSRQILEGIKYYHDKDIIFKDLKPFNILVDEKEDFKFRCFCISKYLDEGGSSEKTLALMEASGISLWSLSPEIRNNLPFNQQTDVWSFGVLMIDIINSNYTCMNINNQLGKSRCIELDQIDEIIKEGKIKEQLPNWIKEEMKDLIESCLRIDPNERSTVDQLLQHELFKI